MKKRMKKKKRFTIKSDSCLGIVSKRIMLQWNHPRRSNVLLYNITLNVNSVGFYSFDQIVSTKNKGQEIFNRCVLYDLSIWDNKREKRKKNQEKKTHKSVQKFLSYRQTDKPTYLWTHPHKRCEDASQDMKAH